VLNINIILHFLGKGDHTGPTIPAQDAPVVDASKKKHQCGSHCKTCKSCVCVKNGEYCSSKCGCGPTCVNEPKPTTGFPPPGWTYEPIETLNKDVIQPGATERNANFDSSPKSTFETLQEFWTDELLDHILNFTRFKAARKNLWRYPKTREDLWRYFLVLLGMGLVKFPKVTDYWKQDPDDLFGSSFFSKLLSGRKYRDFREAIDFDITYIEDYLNFIFKRRWSPSVIFVVDECLVLFKGRFAGRQHRQITCHRIRILCFS